MTKKGLQISNLIMEIEIAQEKARVVLDTILQNYFDTTEECIIKCYHIKAGVQTNIVLDYVFEIKKLTGQLQDCICQKI